MKSVARTSPDAAFRPADATRPGAATPSLATVLKRSVGVVSGIVRPERGHRRLISEGRFLRPLEINGEPAPDTPSLGGTPVRDVVIAPGIGGMNPPEAIHSE